MKTVTVEFGGATLQIPEKTVVQNWLQGLTNANSPEMNTTVSVVPPIGSYWPEQGGIYAGLMRDQNQQDYHLIVADGDPGEVQDIKWGEAGKTIEGANSEWDGKANTLALTASKHSHPAAEWAEALDINNHADWYLPARRELALCYANVPELFAKKFHWSSTQSSAYYAWYQHFDYGYQYGYHKVFQARARAVRRFVTHLTI